jgi:hypothetical protein
LKKPQNNKKRDGLMIRNSTAEFLLFTADSRKDGLEVRFQNETVWLTQKLMAELFQCTTDNISLHLKNIFKDCELEEKAVTEKFSVTASDGKTYQTKHYNLDAFLAFNDRKVLENSGQVTAEKAKAYAESEWERYRVIQDQLYESDFDREVKKLLETKKDDL